MALSFVLGERGASCGHCRSSRQGVRTEGRGCAKSGSTISGIALSSQAAMQGIPPPMVALLYGHAQVANDAALGDAG